MARYALIITASGLVDNVIEYDGSAPFTPPSGQELRVATNDAEPGGTWNGSEFVRAVKPDPTRTQVLMGEVKNATDKTAETVAAEKAELLVLLKSELAAGDLNHTQTQMLLRLERE